MSQQQGSQQSSDQSTNEGEQWQGQVPPLQSPLPWLIQGKGKTSEGPKSEHPSTYDQSIPPLSYGAQDYRQTSSSSSPNVRESAKGGASTKGRTSARGRVSSRVGDSTRVGTSTTPTGDAGYRQYSGGWQVPPWAKPQQNNFGAAWFYVLVIMAILVFPVLCVLIQFIALTVLFVLGVLLLTFMVIAIWWVVRKIG